MAPIITAIKPQKGARQRLNVFLEGVFAFSLDPLVVEEHGLFPGKDLASEDVASLTARDGVEKAHQAALRLLGMRRRSKKELNDRLVRRGFGEEFVAAVIERLERQGLVDDRTFVQLWKQDRETLRPVGKRLMAMELRRMGVDTENIEEGLTNLNESEGAYLAARKKRRSLANLAYPDFKKKLGLFLARRGYGWDVIGQTVDRVWKEGMIHDH
ncbi:MAG: regulatory protein RecX [Chloroflexi bacterium]|nr:regulatory protein RecX [Chloroflexota bacterium]